jgi:hypothetical protein
MEALTRHLTAAAAELNRALAQIGYGLTAQNAFGVAYNGDIDRARDVLAGLPDDVLRRVCDASTCLAGVAAGMLAAPSGWGSNRG